MEKREIIIDELTGIYNRKGFYQATQELFAKNRYKVYHRILECETLQDY